ncbi:ribonuclease DdI-like [Tropilaelaps mercedesae]|uniref:Ribonuclease DdI-like n=1 Tax=Tropilaelaps mercedesae TaxID=418985 RepID=A0A1V9XTI3_9ACAR|nr:ribonuclease DdI-like [Tropilaelaps mercedesae]
MSRAPSSLGSQAAYQPLPPQQSDSESQEQELAMSYQSSRVSYRWFAILCVIALLSASLHENVQIRLSSNKPYFDFFVFSQQTSVGYCIGHSHCVDEHQRSFWTIHGLWPSNDTTWPEMCNLTVKFNSSILDPIRVDLDLYWPSLTSSNSLRFWRHEWQKHGSCAMQVAPVAGVLNYFNTTINLTRTYNVTKFLLDEEIVPSLNRTYTVTELSKALSDDVKAKINIVCQITDGFPYPVLSEVRFCLSKTNLTPIDCEHKDEKCGVGPVHYLPLGASRRNQKLDGWCQLIVNTFSFYVNYLSPM